MDVDQGMAWICSQGFLDLIARIISNVEKATVSTDNGIPWCRMVIIVPSKKKP